MKRNQYVFVMLFTLLVFPALAMAGSKGPWDTKLPFKNAVIDYTHTGMAEGSETLYIRDYGRETARYLKTTTSIMGMTNVDETVEIQDPDWLYRFDIKEKSGTKITNPRKYFQEEYEKLTKAEKKQVEKNSKTMGMSFMGGSGGELEENAAKILGYSCDRINVMGSTVYSIHGAGLPLKTESNMMGMQTKMEATAIKKGAAKKKYFQFPDGIVPVADPQADAMARQMAKQTIDMLKDPEGAKRKGASPMMPPPPPEQTGGGSPDDQPDMEQAMKMLKGLLGK